MPTQDSIAAPGAPRFQLGVLLVHGIGTQPPSETLVRWGDVVLKTIGRATRNEVVATIERAEPVNALGKNGAEAVVGLRAGGHTERWLLCEGWWAASFPAPSYGELVSWSVRALPWSLATHIAERYWAAASLGGGWAKFAAGATAFVELFVTLALAPVFIGLLGLALLLGAIPIPQVRTLILRTQSVLTGTVGDSLAFVESPVRAALIRTRVLEGLERLKQLCERTVILAHSQGAAVVLDALGGIVDPRMEHGTSASHLVPDALLTFGSGINQLASQKALSAGMPTTFAGNPASRMVAALIAAGGLAALLYVGVQAGVTSLRDIGNALTVTFLLWVDLMLLTVAFVVWKEARRWKAAKTALVVIVALISLPVIGWWLLSLLGKIQTILPVAWLVAALLIVVSSMVHIFSEEMKTIFSAPVRYPLGLPRWVDLYASADPVPNGPTTVEGGTHKSIRIWNLGDVLADHAAYWDNLDGFALRVVRLCAETASSPWTSALPRETPFVDERAAWRVGFLQFARQSANAIWLVVFAFLWYRHPADIPVPHDVPGWIPAAVTQFVLLVALIAFAWWVTSHVLRWLWSYWLVVFALLWFGHRAEMPVPHDVPGWIPHAVTQFVLLVALIAFAWWATSSALRWLWSWWVRQEQEAVLAHEQPKAIDKGRGKYALYAMAAVVWMLLLAASLLVWDVSLDPLRHKLGNGPWALAAVLLIMSSGWGLTALSTDIYLRLRREPHASSPPTPTP